MKKTIVLGLMLVFLVTGCNLKLKGDEKISPEEAKVKATEFINSYLMQAGNEVTVDSVVEESGIYKASVSIPAQGGGEPQKVDSYLSLDGKVFFPQAMNIAEYAQKAEEQKKQDTGDKTAKPEVNLEDIEKKDKPEVELFVMSHCPYGTQIEKGIIPAVEALKGKVNFKLKFCDYAMHGDKELKEQMAQYCIQENEPEKLFPYLKCFLNEGDGAKCLSEVKIKETALQNCISETDAKYSIMKNFADKGTWKNGKYPLFDVFKDDNAKYGIGGSPSFVINGQVISANRDAASLLKTMCAGFKEKPAECDVELSATAPSPGFGGGAAASGAASDASCN